MPSTPCAPPRRRVCGSHTGAHPPARGVGSAEPRREASAQINGRDPETGTESGLQVCSALVWIASHFLLMSSYFVLRSGAIALLAWSFAQATRAQNREVALSYFSAQLPLTLRLTPGVQAHYRYSWSPQWSAAVALGYSGATVSDTFDFLPAKNRLTFAERYAVLDACLTRHFSENSAVSLSTSVGLSFAYITADEANIRIFESSLEEEHFKKYHAVGRFLFLSSEARFGPIGRFGGFFQPAFRVPLGGGSRPLEQTIVYEGPGFRQKTTRTYYIEPIIGVHLGLFYRLH